MDESTPTPLKLCVVGAMRSNHVHTRTAVFLEMGHRVSAVTLLPRDDAPYHQIPVRRDPARRFWWLAAVRDQVRALRAVAADIYHVHYALGPLAYLTVILGRRPLVISTMGGDALFEEQHSLSRVEQWLVRSTLRSADLVTAKTWRMVDVLRKHGVEPERIVRVVWGIDVSRFLRGDRAAARRHFDIDEQAQVLVSPRHLRPIYNIHVIVDAFLLVARRYPQAVLLVGRRHADPDYESSIRSRLKGAEGAERVRFLEPVAPARMPDLYTAADVVVSVPSSDGLPQTLLEAQACGTAVLVAEGVQFDEFCVDGETVLSAPLSVAGVASALQRLLDDADLRERIAGSGRETVLRRADLHGEASRVESLYRDLLAGRRTSQRTSMLRRVMMALGFAWSVVSPALSTLRGRMPRMPGTGR